MQRWYNHTTPYQRVLLYACCVPGAAFYGAGVVAFLVLLYCEFGRRGT